MVKVPKLTVVGAGPGDPGLFTLRGVEVLQDADVVLYDALASTALLGYAPQAEHIFVGKRKGCVAYHQEQINELIISRARSHGHVVRLKGGDPFVFGRGAEELEHAAKHGLQVAMVPGISASISVPSLQQIPVTKRGDAESFWVITATTKDHGLSEDIALAAQSNATVVILMGMSKLAQIVAIFKAQGKHETPIAIIQNGTLSNEKIGIGTISTIEHVVESQNLSNPATIIIGAVVGHRKKMGLLQKRVQYQQTWA